MTLSEGIVKINSKALEASELKKFDKLEKEGIALNGAVTKGKIAKNTQDNVCFDWKSIH